MFLARTLLAELQAMMAIYPVVTVIGPRQSGKSTLVRQAYPDLPYVSLEDPDERLLAVTDPRAFLARFPNGAILDEIQQQPQLLSYIQGIVDARQQKGLFLLTGSHQLALHAAITQSLAGRTAVLKLLPLSMQELTDQTVGWNVDQHLLAGGYPSVCAQDMPALKFYRDYIQTYLERDVRTLSQVQDLVAFQQFMRFCAGHTGQVINYETFSNALGVSVTTIKNWLSILEASFIIFRLSPYYENFGKRIRKAQKLYFFDTGVACYLSNITEPDQLRSHPLKGGLFENLMILEIYKHYLHQGTEPYLYFFRESNENEVDLLIQQGNRFIALEIKSAQTFHGGFLKGLYYFKKIAKERCQAGFLVYTGMQTQKVDTFELVNFKNLAAVYGAVSHKE